MLEPKKIIIERLTNKGVCQLQPQRIYIVQAVTGRQNQGYFNCNAIAAEKSFVNQIPAFRHAQIQFLKRYNHPTQHTNTLYTDVGWGLHIHCHTHCTSYQRMVTFVLVYTYFSKICMHIHILIKYVWSNTFKLRIQ